MVVWKSKDVKATSENLACDADTAYDEDTASNAFSANDDVTAFSIFENATSVFINGNITESKIVNFTSEGVLRVSQIITDGVYNATYTYDADTSATTAVIGVHQGLDDFVTWIPIIIIILSAAIILGLVMRSFKQ